MLDWLSEPWGFLGILGRHLACVHIPACMHGHGLRLSTLTVQEMGTAKDHWGGPHNTNCRTVRRWSHAEEIGGVSAELPADCSWWLFLFPVAHGRASLGRILQRSSELGSLLEASRDRSGGRGRVLCWEIAGEDIVYAGVSGLSIAFLRRGLSEERAF